MQGFDNVTILVPQTIIYIINNSNPFSSYFTAKIFSSFVDIISNYCWYALCRVNVHRITSVLMVYMGDLFEMCVCVLWPHDGRIQKYKTLLYSIRSGLKSKPFFSVAKWFSRTYLFILSMNRTAKKEKKMPLFYMALCI